MKRFNPLHGPRSLTRDFSIGFLVIILLISILVFSISGLIFLKIEGNKFKEDASSTFQNFKKLIVTPLWHYDDNEIAAICMTFLSGGMVSKIIIYSGDDRQLYAFGNTKENDSNIGFFSDNLFYNTKLIGKVEFYPKKPKYFKHAKFYFYTTILAISIISIFITIATWWLLRIYVNRPLDKLLSWINQVEKGEYDNAEVDYPQREIQSVVNHFSLMVDSIKNREQRIRDSEERYRVLFENANDAIFVAQDQSIKFSNHRTLEFTGYSEDELAKTPFGDLIHPEDREMVIDRHTRRLSGDEDLPKTYSFRVINNAGDELLVELSAVTITWEGRPATLNFLRDITEQKRIEAQLKQAIKMESIGTLAGGIAHDFNNILSPIILYTEMVLEDISGKDPLRFNLKEVLKASLRAKDLVKQILTFSHQAEQEKIPLIINPIIKEALKLLRASLPSTIEIRQNIKAEDGVVLADPTQIHQILMNLCTNAAHSMRERGGVLEVSLVDVDLYSDDTDHTVDLEPGQYIKLIVSDTGRGIESAIMGKIFEPYFTTQEKGKGTGLGLSVVHGIVRTHGGHISAYSDPGKGTRFDVYLPLFDLADIKAETISPEKLTLGNEHILLVDDEKPIVDVVQQMLERLGYQVTVRTSSIEALEVFRASADKFDLVITDLTMPNMTGDKLAGELMNIRPDISIILCTGFSEKVSKEKAEALGIKGFLMKPIVTSDLAKLIREVIDKR